MYRVCEVAAMLAVLGLLVHLVGTARRTRRCIWPASGEPAVVLLVAYLLMCSALAYYSLVVFLTQNVSTALGWYLYSVVVPEVVLLGAGWAALFGRKRALTAVASVCILAIVLDLYNMHFLLMPYYTGMIVHHTSGLLETFRLETLMSSLGLMLQRLSTNDPACVGPSAIAGLWAAYLCSTVALGAIAVFHSRGATTPAENSGRP